MLKFRLEHKPQVYETLADKCKMPVAQDINAYSLDQISVLMDLYSQD